MTRWAAPLLLLLPLTSSAEPGVVQSEHSVTVKIESGSLLRARRMEEPGCYATSTRMVWETAVVQAVSGTLSRKKRSGEVITCRFTLTELRAERTGIYGSWSPFVETTVEPVKVTFESRC